MMFWLLFNVALSATILYYDCRLPDWLDAILVSVNMVSWAVYIGGVLGMAMFAAETILV